MKTDSYYFAVRKSDAHEWIDVNTWGHCEITAKDKADKTDKIIELWAKDNPVVRIARFKLIETVDRRKDKQWT